ncbi:MAG: pyridoxal phosphate-dependent aminotransferase [Ornithinimicrobium sp.]
MTQYSVERMRGFGTSIFTEMSALAMTHDAVNLGQGFPDTDTPAAIKDIAMQIINNGQNQYPPARGMPILKEAVAAHQQRFYSLAVDPDTEVLVTVGASEAIAASVLALVEPGDEVLTFDPSYDAYAAAIALAGGVHRSITLRFADNGFDAAVLAAAVSDRTKVILLNNPHNPTGKVFTRQELEQIAEVATAHDVIVVTDEVYEHLTFDGLRHVPMASLPGMAQRTLTISSGAKTFAATGWKVGWVHGPAPLIDAVARVKQYLTFTGAGPFQPAIAHGLGLPDDFFDHLRASMQARRDVLVAALNDLGLATAPSQGSYFVVADVSSLGVDDALTWCRALPGTVGVAGVPVSAFCQDSEAARTLVRFGFCKKESVLREGTRRLAALGRGSVATTGMHVTVGE